MKLNEWKKQNDLRLPNWAVAQILEEKQANYFNELWNKNEESQNKVKKQMIKAHKKFNSIFK